MARMKLLIDTDPGVDDALAILMAHRHADVLGLSIAAGNVGLEHTVSNALKLVEIIGAQTPVFTGCPAPLLHPASDAAFVHGNDGFGDTGYAKAARIASKEHAAAAILRLSREHAGELVIVAMAPLTNLAVALTLDPALPQRIARLVIMGGAVTGHGNTERVAAEFNIGFDPEAAHIVFSQWPHFELVDWELTMRHGMEFERIDTWLQQPCACTQFFAQISRKTRDWSRAGGRQRLMVADPLAMAVALQPDIVRNSVKRHVEIALQGPATRGATIVDWEGRQARPANADIVLDVDQARFEALVASALA